jgi:hypothetical protein
MDKQGCPRFFRVYFIGEMDSRAVMMVIWVFGVARITEERFLVGMN